MTATSGAALEPLGILGANDAVGIYHYDTNPFLVGPSLPENNHREGTTAVTGTAMNPKVQPACIVERTCGDRRLGSHVLAGLELLLPRLVDETRLSPAAVRALFPPCRFPCTAAVDNASTTNITATAATSAPLNDDGDACNLASVTSTAELAYFNAQLAQVGVEMGLWVVPEEFHLLEYRTSCCIRLDETVLADLYRRLT